MFEWLRKRVTCAGSVLFRGSLPPRVEEFGYLQKHDISVSPGKPQANLIWQLVLQHPSWGTALLYCMKSDTKPVRILLEHCPALSKPERASLLQSGCEICLRMAGSRENILTDRKMMLRYLQAVMGTDGWGAVDYLAQSIWTPEALREELSHEADLDISQIHALHVVRKEGSEEAGWLHTHGLAEIGFFDFDILNPTGELDFVAADLLRVIAYAIVEGKVAVSTNRFALARPGGYVRFIPADEFDRKADPQFTALRSSAGEYHLKNRAVLCEPTGRFLGWFSRRVVPSRFLSSPIEDEMVFGFSHDASELMAQRARNTYGFLRTLVEELAEFHVYPIVKLGYQVDGGTPDDREHLWFTVHALHDDTIDATLDSPPFGIARFRPGDRRLHPVELLSDWTIMTPLGPISPRSTVALRRLRANRDQALAIATVFRGAIERAREKQMAELERT